MKMDGGTHVQWPNAPEGGRVGEPMGNGPLDLGDLVVAKTLNFREADLDLFERVAFFRNILADVSKKKMPRRWSAKSLAESELAGAAADLRKLYGAMESELGPIPPKADKKAVLAYAKRVQAWEKANSR